MNKLMITAVLMLLVCNSLASAYGDSCFSRQRELACTKTVEGTLEQGEALVAGGLGVRLKTVITHFGGEKSAIVEITDKECNVLAERWMMDGTTEEITVPDSEGRMRGLTVTVKRTAPEYMIGSRWAELQVGRPCGVELPMLFFLFR